MVLSTVFRTNWLIICFGCILILAGVCMLFWNEGRAVYINMSLDEIYENAVTIYQNDKTDKNYDGRIVHFSGPIIVGEPLTEPDYNIQVQAIKLKRLVQMYQWVEETIENNYGESLASVQTDTKTYYYTRSWSDKLIDSRQFYIQSGHENPSSFPIESHTHIADAVFIGKYELDDKAKEKFNNFVSLTSDSRPENPFIKVHFGLYYHTRDIFKPEVGDIRVVFLVAGIEGEMTTVVGKLENNKIIPHTTVYGIDIMLVYPGDLTLENVISLEYRLHLWSTWVWRMIGWMLIFLGVQCTWTILRTILSRLRFVSALVREQHFLVSTTVLSFLFSLIMASIAWILHRPVIGASLFLAASSPFVWLARRFL